MKQIALVICVPLPSNYLAVFSLSFSSAGKVQFLTGKAKKLHSLWGGEVGSGVRDMASLSLGKLETSFSYNV